MINSGYSPLLLVLLLFHKSRLRVFLSLQHFYPLRAAALRSVIGCRGSQASDTPPRNCVSSNILNAAGLMSVKNRFQKVELSVSSLQPFKHLHPGKKPHRTSGKPRQEEPKKEALTEAFILKKSVEEIDFYLQSRPICKLRDWSSPLSELDRRQREKQQQTHRSRRFPARRCHHGLRKGKPAALPPLTELNLTFPTCPTAFQLGRVHRVRSFSLSLPHVPDDDDDDDALCCVTSLVSAFLCPHVCFKLKWVSIVHRK